MSTDADATLTLAQELIRRPSVSPEDHGCLQVIGQRYTTSSQAAIFLSSEALFGASLGALLLGETMPPLGYAGCALMFTAMLLVEVVPEITRRRASERLKPSPNLG